MDTVLQRINTAAVKLLEPLTLEEAYQTIVEEGVNLVGGDDGLIILEKDGLFENVYGSSPQATLSKLIRTNGHTYTAFKERRVLVINSQEVKTAHPEISKTGVKSAIFIPLYYKRKSIGVLCIRSYTKSKFTQDEPDILKVFGTMATLAIRNIQLYNETKRALELRDLFIAFASHELRTPLTPINGYIQLIQKKLNAEKPIDTKWVSKLADETKTLTGLVEELLEINKIRTGKLSFNFREVDLISIIHIAVERIQFAHPDHKIIFKNKLKEAKLRGDNEKLLQVVSNILENSAKHSPQDKPITVSLSSNLSYYYIDIEDRGKGIPREDLPYVFEIFYKGKTNYKEGMGLGLYLVKEIVDRHSGKISIQSEENQGTVVKVKLPYK